MWELCLHTFGAMQYNQQLGTELYCPQLCRLHLWSATLISFYTTSIVHPPFVTLSLQIFTLCLVIKSGLALGWHLEVSVAMCRGVKSKGPSFLQSYLVVQNRNTYFKQILYKSIFQPVFSAPSVIPRTRWFIGKKVSRILACDSFRNMVTTHM